MLRIANSGQASAWLHHAWTHWQKPKGILEADMQKRQDWIVTNGRHALDGRQDLWWVLGDYCRWICLQSFAHGKTKTGYRVLVPRSNPETDDILAACRT